MPVQDVDTSKLIFAKDLTNLKKTSSYRKFEQGYFKNVPDMGGYMYIFKVTGAKIVLLVDTANSKYSKTYYHNKGIHFLIYKAPNIDSFVSGLYQNISDLIDMVNRILDQEQSYEDAVAGGIPHGYKLDDNGKVVVDPVESTKVRKIYKLYSQYGGSIRRIASELNTNFSHVREVLHDYRYEDMPIKIIPEGVLKKVRQMMDKNRKNRTT